MRLVFRGDHTRRPELGSSGTRGDWRATGLLKFDSPGSAIRIVASLPDVAPVTYEAMPMSGHGAMGVTRNLTTGLSISPGVLDWPPTSKGLALQPGTNTVNIEVAAVERPLVGENVELTVNPALGFYELMPNVGWLWPSLLWPLYAIVLALWAVVLRRQNQAQKSWRGATLSEGWAINRQFRQHHTKRQPASRPRSKLAGVSFDRSASVRGDQVQHARRT
jgi:hypothetical protein